jgi:hypothetical protein
MTEPPLSEGAVKGTVAVVALTVAVPIVGAPGTPNALDITPDKIGILSRQVTDKKECVSSGYNNLARSILTTKLVLRTIRVHCSA